MFIIKVLMHLCNKSSEFNTLGTKCIMQEKVYANANIYSKQ